MKRLFAVALVLMLVLTGCSSTPKALKDGRYMGESSPDDEGAIGMVTINVAGGKIDACEFVTLQTDGSIKDNEYGKVNGEISSQDFYERPNWLCAPWMSTQGNLLKRKMLRRSTPSAARQSRTISSLKPWTPHWPKRLHKG